MLQAFFFAFYGRHALELVQEHRGEEPYPAKEVNEPFVARLPACKALVYSIAHGLYQRGQQRKIALEEHARIGLDFLAANFGDAHRILAEFAGRHTFVIVRDFTRAVIEEIHLHLAAGAELARKNLAGAPLQELVERGRQYGAVLEQRDAVAFLLAEPETHNRLVAGLVASHDDPRAVAVTPRGARMHNKTFGQFYAGDAPEILAFNLRQVFRLLLAVQVLQAAPAALAIQRAARLYAVGICAIQHFHDMPAGKILFRERHRHLAEFARQRARDKAHAAIRQARHTLAALHHFFDADFEHLADGRRICGASRRRALVARPARLPWLVEIAGHRA